MNTEKQEHELDSLVQQEQIQNIEATNTSTYNCICWYFYEIAQHFFNILLNLTYGPTLQLLAIKQGYHNSVGVVMGTVILATSNCIAAFAGPFLGGLSDHYGIRKGAVIGCEIIFLVCCFLNGLTFSFYPAVILFFIVRLFFEMSRLFYEVQIPYVMDQKSRTAMQAIGGVLSYFGSLLGIILQILSSFIWKTYTPPAMAQKETLSFGSLRETSMLMALLSIYIFIPYFFHVEKRRKPKPMTLKENLKQTWNDTILSFKLFFKDRDCILHFIGFTCVSSALSLMNGLLATLLIMMCGLTQKQTVFVALAMNVVALICGFPFAWLLSKKGPKLLMIINIVCDFIGIFFFTITNMKIGSITISVWVIIFAVLAFGIAMSIIYVTQRQMMLELAPPDKLAKMAGVAKMAARLGSVFLPIIFSAFISSVTSEGKAFAEKQSDAYRIGQIPVLILLIIALIMYILIRNRHKLYLSGKRAPYDNIIPVLEMENQSNEMKSNEGGYQSIDSNTTTGTETSIPEIKKDEEIEENNENQLQNNNTVEEEKEENYEYNDNMESNQMLVDDE